MWFLYWNRLGAATYANPRDTVFALLGLLKAKTFLEADYGSSVEGVYTDLATAFLGSGDASLLCLPRPIYNISSRLEML